MNSVRQRIEREQRAAEPPERIVTSERRVALGASGPTMSTRMRETLALDATEIVEASPHTRVGGTGFMSGDMVRVRDRQVATEAMKPEPPRPKTPEQLAGEAGFAEYNRLQERKAREEQERLDKIARRKQQEQDEVAARERKAKLAQTAFKETLVLREISDLSPDENQMFWERFALRDATDVVAASIIAEAIRAGRKG